MVIGAYNVQNHSKQDPRVYNSREVVILLKDQQAARLKHVY
jgi:hypothetical protein